MANIYKKQAKRKFLTKEYCMNQLIDSLPRIFQAYSDAVDRFNVEIEQTSPEARIRLVSSLLNAKMIDSFIHHFPTNWRVGRYKRVIFRFDGIQLIIKKLNKNDKPSSIPTKFWTAITNQEQLSLFKYEEGIEEPIVIFGYTKTASDKIVNPRIVFFDGERKWKISKEDFVTKPVVINRSEDIELRTKTQKRKRQIK